MTDLERDRLNSIVNDALDAAPGTVYDYKGRTYRTRTVTITVAEMGGPRDAVNFKQGWTIMPPALTSQLLERVETGEAVLLTVGERP